MKIVDETDVPTVEFVSLGSGLCFKYSGNVYMKTMQPDGAVFNAVRLHDGFLGMFRPDTGVRRVIAFVTVEAK